MEWDINGEGPGKILLKYKERLGQQKFMICVIKKQPGRGNKNYKGPKRDPKRNDKSLERHLCKEQHNVNRRRYHKLPR